MKQTPCFLTKKKKKITENLKERNEIYIKKEILK